MTRSNDCKRKQTNERIYTKDTDFSVTKKAKLAPAESMNYEDNDDDDDETMWDPTEDPDGADFFDQQESTSSSPTNDQDSTTNDDNKANPHPPIHDSPIALRPQCWTHHHGYKGKGKARMINKFTLTPSTQCGKYTACHAASIHPPSAQPPSPRLRTRDPLQDLKRWITTLNETLSGASEDRTTDRYIATDPRFTRPLLRLALVFAVGEIKNEHVELTHLNAYGQRRPYGLNVKNAPVAPEADLAYLDVAKGETFAHVRGREELVSLVVTAADELDYLRREKESKAERILKRKMALARLGNEGEAWGLVERGFVGEEWVESECWRF